MGFGVQVHIGYGTLLLNVAVHVRDVGEEAVGGAAVVRAAVSGGAEFLHTGESPSHTLVYANTRSLPPPHIAPGVLTRVDVFAQKRLVRAGMKMQCIV